MPVPANKPYMEPTAQRIAGAAAQCRALTDVFEQWVFQPPSEKAHLWLPQDIVVSAIGTKA